MMTRLAPCDASLYNTCHLAGYFMNYQDDNAGLECKVRASDWNTFTSMLATR